MIKKKKMIIRTTIGLLGTLLSSSILIQNVKAFISYQPNSVNAHLHVHVHTWSKQQLQQQQQQQQQHHHQQQYQQPPSRKTPLYGKLWDGLQTEESDEIKWYIINCVAGLELDLLAQCREMCKDYPKSDVLRFVVPTMREARSHGKRNVVEDIVLYPGYVFAQLRLCEEVYEEISSLVTCRSWMGTQRRMGHKRLPSVPLSLSEEEIASFKGLEEKMEKEMDVSVEDLLKMYEGFEVEGMVKILEGKHSGEDGIVKRLKGGKISVRLFTYGSQFDEWFMPNQIRPLTELEVMRGLSGQETPIRQDDFDISIGRPLRPRTRQGQGQGQGQGQEQGQFSKRNMRNELMSNVKGQRGPRNRRQDRMSRGEGRDKWGNSREQLRQEEKNWKEYQREEMDQQMDKNAYDVDSQWGRSKNSKKVEEDWSQFTSTTSSSDDKKDGKKDDDFFNDLMSELSSDLDTNPKQSESTIKKDEDDFFSSLMSELSIDSKDEVDSFSNNDDEDNFFATLEKEMSGTDTKKKKKNDDDVDNVFDQFVSQSTESSEDDFFTQLETSLKSDLKDDKVQNTVDDDDFFKQMENSLKSNLNENKHTENDDFFAQLEATLSTNLNDDIKDTTVTHDTVKTKKDNSSESNLSKLTVPVLKSMLKEKGLKVSGKKAELIERLTNS